MSDLFSTPAEHALQHPELDLDVLHPQAGPSSMGDAAGEMTLEEAFEVDDTVQRILAGGYKTIGLQFPDELLPSSPRVFKAIQKAIAASGAQAYVLADSTYGSCCPDVLSCLHLPADFLVHYGHACLTPTDALPVHYVFPRRRLDVRHAFEALQAASEEESKERRGIIVVWDVAYDWLADEMISSFTSGTGRPMSFAIIRRPETAQQSPPSEKGKEKASPLRETVPPEGLAMADCVVWYIGEEGRSLLNLQMTHAACPVFHYSPTDRSVNQLVNTSRLLSKRLYAVHQAMASDVFGLIVSNIGLSSSRPLLEQLRKALAKARKKSYTLSVGRLNPAKLANFETIECFVLVGCQEGGVVDSKDFYRPIVTPWELLLALEGPEHEWDPAKWTLDLGKILENAKGRNSTGVTGDSDDQSEVNGVVDDEDDDAPEFSLVTGTYRTRKRYGTAPGEGAGKGLEDAVGAMTLRNQEFALAKLESAGSTYLQSRSFQGLEMRYGMDEPAVLEEGRGGMARGYGGEG